MSFVIHVKSKKNDSVYAYSVENYRDPVTQKYRQHRTYIGKVSPDTGEIIPKKDTSHPRKAFERPEPHVAPSNVDTSWNEAINELSKRVDQLQKQNRTIIETMRKMAEVVSSIKI